MSQMKGMWHYLLIEPFTWLFYFLFQPAKFKGDIEARSLWGRTLQMLRLQLPMFLCYYPLALIARAIMYIIFPTAYTPCSSDGLDLINPCFLFIAAKGTWAGPAAIPVGPLFGTTFGISISLANGLVGGVIYQRLAPFDASGRNVSDEAGVGIAALDARGVLRERNDAISQGLGPASRLLDGCCGGTRLWLPWSLHCRQYRRKCNYRRWNLTWHRSLCGRYRRMSGGCFHGHCYEKPYKKSYGGWESY